MSKAPKIVDFKFIDETAPQDVIDNELDQIVNDIDDEPEEELIKVEEKPEIDVDEIFELQSKEEPEEKEVEAHPVFEPPLETPKPKPEPKPKKTKPVKLNKDGTERKKRAPLTEAEKAKRRESLKKAQAVRKQKTIERAEAKELAKKEKELLKKKKIKDVEKLEREVNDDEEAEPPPQNRLKGDPGLTKEDLVKAQYDAIMAYENLRKERKAEKKKQQLIEQEQQKMMNKIHQATVGYRYGDGSNRFDRCY